MENLEARMRTVESKLMMPDYLDLTDNSTEAEPYESSMNEFYKQAPSTMKTLIRDALIDDKVVESVILEDVVESVYRVIAHPSTRWLLRDLAYGLGDD